MADSLAAELVFDAWTPMAFKRALGNKKQPGTSWLAPTWVGDHARRLQAYKVLQAYLDNAARYFLATTDAEKIEQHREYGDADLIVSQIRAALLGNEQTVVVYGADEFNPEASSVPETGPDGVVAPDAGETPDDEARRAFELQEWARDWATDERFGLKLMESERNSVGLGDGLYSLGWSNDKGRPRLRVWDPGFYFPVLEDDNEDDYPETLHVAWELESDEPGKRLVRRITWRLIDWSKFEFPGGEAAPTYDHPWNDEPTTVTCLMTDATWKIDLAKQTVEDFTEGQATYADYEVPGTDEVVEWRDIDQELDFIPVVHVPNTVSIINHFGRSSLATILQILDDLSNADTDLQASSATTGKPPIALSGARLEAGTELTYKPGEVWQLGADGKLSALDTSSALETLMRYVEFLLKRLSVNSRLPESLLGRTELNGEIAGITMALSFGPLETMVKEMRLVRNEKYPLLFKFAHRMAAKWGEDVPQHFDLPIEVEFGSFLPDDLETAIKNATQAYAAKIISLETAVQIMLNAGLPIEDVAEEVLRIQGRDFDGANALLDATGDEAQVGEYLGRDIESARPAPPTIPTPPVLP